MLLASPATVFAGELFPDNTELDLLISDEELLSLDPFVETNDTTNVVQIVNPGGVVEA